MALYTSTKRLFDVVISFTALVILSPFIALIAAFIRIDSTGPVLYCGRRVGRFAKPFRLFKFRTMVVHADRMGASSTPDDDPRITRAGKVLRRFKLDELPQLLNVLRGDMSLIGPRPQVAWIVKLYGEVEKGVLNVRPGIADYAFVMLASEGEVLRGSTDPDKDYLERIHPNKMRLSLHYVRNCSFWFDMKILVDTAMLSFFKRSWFFQDAKTEVGERAP